MRNPREFELLWVIGAKYPMKPMALTWSRDRGFFEPITNTAAAPVIGDVLAWRYRGDDSASDRAAYDAVVKDCMTAA